MLIERSGNGPNLILLHGWATDRYFWKYLIPIAERFYTTIRVDLPGHGDGCGSSFSFFREDELVTELSNLCDGGATWIGWSLGGFLAQRVAQLYPHKVNRLICMGSAARFTQAADWPQGITKKDFNNFIKVFKNDSPMALEHFLKLQVMGTERAVTTLELLKFLIVKNYEVKELTAALELLRDQDTRKAIENYQGPILFIGGEADKLVSEKNLRLSSNLAFRSKVFIVEKAGHAPMLSHPAYFYDGLQEYLERTQRCA